MFYSDHTINAYVVECVSISAYLQFSMLGFFPPLIIHANRISILFPENNRVDILGSYLVIIKLRIFFFFFNIFFDHLYQI